MAAGIPGLGLGGLFFILSALLAPLFELPRTFRGRSSWARWHGIASQLALALVMVVALELALVVLLTALGVGAPEQTASGTGPAGGAHGGAPSADSTGLELAPLPVPPVLVTLGVLASVLGAAKAADILLRNRIPARLGAPWRWLMGAASGVRRRLAELTDG
jgi:hypothetical protein